MKKNNAWTMAELVVAITVLIILSGIAMSVIKPNNNKAKIYMYAAMKNLSKGNMALIEKNTDFIASDSAVNGNDWYCINLADVFALAGTPNCSATAANSAVNFKFANGMTIQGIAGQWYTPFSGAEYKFKNIVIDIDGEEGANKVGHDRFPMRIYRGSVFDGILQPVNCGSDVVYNASGAPVTLTDSTGKSPYCKQKFNMTGSSVANNFLTDDQVVTYDIYKPNTSDETSTASMVASSISPMAADCGAYGGNGFFSREYCSALGLRVHTKCAKAETCSSCKGTSNGTAYDICPYKEDGTTLTTSEAECTALAASVNSIDVPCFTLLHKPTGGLGMLTGTILGELDI